MTQSLVTSLESLVGTRPHQDASHSAESRMQYRRSAENTMWYDSRSLENCAEPHAMMERLFNLCYRAIMLYRHNYQSYIDRIPKRITKVLHLDGTDAECLGTLPSSVLGAEDWVIASADTGLLDSARARGFATCFRAYVDDAASLRAAIDLGERHTFLLVRFRDPTNIPLELVIASLQRSHTTLLKEICDPNDVDDAIVSHGVMEVGADGVMFSPVDHSVVDAFIAKRGEMGPRVAIDVATVIKTEPVGMGHRSCIDVATLFSEREGMLVGSTSQGGILCCPEVFFLPYMELRPFRVNAGGVHSYVYNTGDRTNYMSELRAGSPVMVVGVDGRTRPVPVGRIKTEVRPLRLIEIEFAGCERVNVLMQDDWHVRVFSDQGLPRNITELAPGDRVLGHVTRPGRHVGIRVEETILEK